MNEPVCGEFTEIIVKGKKVRIVCGQPLSAHSTKAAKMDVGMDHAFMPATWDGDDPMPEKQ